MWVCLIWISIEQINIASHFRWKKVRVNCFHESTLFILPFYETFHGKVIWISNLIGICLGNLTPRWGTRWTHPIASWCAFQMEWQSLQLLLSNLDHSHKNRRPTDAFQTVALFSWQSSNCRNRYPSTQYQIGSDGIGRGNNAVFERISFG